MGADRVQEVARSLRIHREILVVESCPREARKMHDHVEARYELREAPLFKDIAFHEAYVEPLEPWALLARQY